MVLHRRWGRDLAAERSGQIGLLDSCADDAEQRRARQDRMGGVRARRSRCAPPAFRPRGQVARGARELRANLTAFRDGKVIEMAAFESPEASLAAASAGTG
jgi:hypothetical protein